MNDVELAVLNEAVRGKGGLQDTVEELRREIRELQSFRSTLIGIQIAIGILSPLLMRYFT